MEYLSLGLSVLSMCVVVVGGLILKSYLPSYMNEKGKNLATKEDISFITNEVERVKSLYAGEVETLKSTLMSENQTLEKRRKIYEEICNSLRIFTVGHKTGDEERDRFLAAYASSWLWASDSVVKALNHFLDLQIENAARPGAVDQLVLKQAYARIALEMRRDVGFPESSAQAVDYKFVKF